MFIICKYSDTDIAAWEAFWRWPLSEISCLEGDLITFCSALKKYAYFDVLTNVLKLKYLIIILTAVFFDITFNVNVLNVLNCNLIITNA